MSRREAPLDPSVRRRLATWGLTIAVGVGQLTATAATSQQGNKTFRDAVEVTEVPVAVWVFKKGAPVRDLSVEDFLLFDRGKPQEILSCERIERIEGAGALEGDTTAVALSTEIADTAVDPAAATQRSGIELSGGEPIMDASARRNFLVLFDLHRLGGNLAIQAVESMRAQLAQPLPAGDRWGVAVHGVSVRGDRNMSARLLLGFTNDRDRLGRAFDAVDALIENRPLRTAAILNDLSGGVAGALRGSRSSEAFDGVSRSAALTLLATGARRGAQTGRFDVGVPLGWLGVEAPDGFDRDAEEGWFGKSSRLKVSAGSSASLLRWFALSMADLVTFLRDVPGENHLLLLSPGGYGQLQDSFTTARMKPMLAAFRRTGWTFQAIDVTGRGFRANDMFYMANETGGTLVENVRSVEESFARIREQTSVTYLLSFRPSKIKADGAFHKLEVKLRDKSLADRIRHRAGYFAPSPAGEGDALEARMRMMEAVLGEEEWREIEVEVGVSPATRRGDAWVVPVAVAVDSPTLLEGHERAELEVKIEGYALDAGGGVTDLFVDDATIDLAAVGWLAGNRLRLARELTLPSGTYRLRLWVENATTGRSSLTTTTISVSDGL